MTIVDRFEEEYAVLETEEGMVRVMRTQLPAEVREGDVLVNIGGVWTVDTNATEMRRSELRDRLKKLLRKKD